MEATGQTGGALLADVAAAVTGGQANRGSLRRMLPWLVDLPAHAQAACLDELAEAAQACRADGGFDALAQALWPWRATAQAYADGVTANGDELDWLDAPVPVERPE